MAPNNRWPVYRTDGALASLEARKRMSVLRVRGSGAVTPFSAGGGWTYGACFAEPPD